LGKTGEFRKYAEDARREAKEAPTKLLKDTWLRLARHWDKLASAREKKPNGGHG
jgi:hypothetical protein